MSRDRDETVTHTLTTLVHTDNLEDAAGWISVFRKRDVRHTAIRVANIEERGLLQKVFGIEGQPLVSGITEMRQAFLKKNEPAFWRAFEKVGPWWPTLPGVTETFSPIGNNWAGAREVYAYLMSYLLQDARFIMWQPEPFVLRPAVFCLDMKTAVFVNIAMGHLRVCANAKCGIFFAPKKTNQDYHNAKCGGAWRTARSRRRKEAAEEEKKKAAKKKARKSSR